MTEAVHVHEVKPGSLVVLQGFTGLDDPEHIDAMVDEIARTAGHRDFSLVVIPEDFTVAVLDEDALSALLAPIVADLIGASRPAGLRIGQTAPVEQRGNGGWQGARR